MNEYTSLSTDEGDGVVDTAVLIGGNAELVTATPTASVKSDPHIQGVCV